MQYLTVDYKIMQSNLYRIKTVKTKQESRENNLKTAYKGKTWERGTDKREMYNYAVEAR